MSDRMTILVPIRYPLTDESTRTLDEAGRIAAEHEDADVVVVHVDRFQHNEATGTVELSHAISAVLDDVHADVVTRRGFFVEEVILEEAEALEADVIVVGAKQTPLWRRLLRRLLGDDPAIGSYLEAETDDDVEVVEIDAETPTPKTEAESEAGDRTASD